MKLPVQAAVFVLAVALAAAFDGDGGGSLLPDGPGREVIARACTGCHSVDRIRGVRLGKDEWWDKINDMVDRGAKANDQETEAMVAYLVRNFGKGSKVWINTAPVVEIKSVLDFSVKESEALVAYRQANGKFGSWNDLLKVPGIDAAKVEAKKDLMLF